ncbi:MAG: hypothetical protein V7691_12315 [Galbibacter orientalis]
MEWVEVGSPKLDSVQFTDCSLFGLWFMVYGLWFMVYGLWFMVN